MRTAVLVCGLVLAWIYPSAAESGHVWQTVADPAALGWSGAKLDEARSFSESLLTDTVMIVDRSGRVVQEWGDVERATDIFSIRKSLISLLFGIHAARGEIKLQATMADLSIDDKLGLTAAEKGARVVHLLKARSGIYHPAAWETQGMIENRPERGAHAPDEQWYYNNWDFNAVNTILERSTGQSVTQSLIASLAAPLGFEDFSARQSFTLFEDLSEHPSAILWMSARDLARVGLMLLWNGEWHGKQIVPKTWIAESTAVHSDLGFLGGYGYSWWVARDGKHFPFVDLPDGTFSARGTGEQVLLVIPAWDTVIVHRGAVCGPGGELMHVTDFGRLLQKIVAARSSRLPVEATPPGQMD